MKIMVPLQHNSDYLVQQLWKARVWLNQQRRQGRQPTTKYDVPPLLRKL